MITSHEVQPTGNGAALHERRFELDWLRGVVVGCVILYHVVGIFAAGTNLYLSDVGGGFQLAVPNLFLTLWPIPLLFAIAGAAASFALRSQSARSYLRARVVRLLLPFLFGTLVLVPLQVYGVLLSEPSLLNGNVVPITVPHPLDSFPRFYLQYLLGYWYFLGHYSSPREFVFWGHLWFVARLIVCSFLALPVLLWLNTSYGRRLIGQIVRVLRWPPAMVLPGLVVGGAVLLLRQSWGRPPLASWVNLDWAQFGVLVLSFLFGYVLYADPRGIDAIRRGGLFAALLGLITFGLLVTVNWGTLPGAVGVNLRRVTEGLTDWLWVLALLSVGTNFLARSHPVLPYVNEAALPVYVLHMPVLVVVAAVVLPLAAPVGIKMLVLFAGTLLLTVALYALVIRRFAVTRVLLGIHPRAAAPSG